MACWAADELPPPVIGRATPNDGRPTVKPGFFPNALTLTCSDGPLLFQMLCYPQMVNKKVMLATELLFDVNYLQLSISGEAY